MPTGYTADVGDGKVTEFPEFAMQCARAFGALITMRDEPADAPIPDEFKPSDHHERGLAEAQERLRTAQDWTAPEAAEAAHRANEKALEAHEDDVARAREIQMRYEAMLAQVERWQPPTPEHVEYKKFMVDQLKESIRFDCSISERDAPRTLSGEEYREHEIERALWSIDYHAREGAAEVERARSRTSWVRALKESLSGVLNG